MKKKQKSYVGCQVVANHKASNDTEYQRIQGYVVSQRSVVGDDKGMVLVIQTELHDKGTDGILFAYHTVYFYNLQGVRVIRRDAVRDSLAKRS